MGNVSGTNHAQQRAEFVRSRLPETGLFAGHEWRIAPRPFPLGKALTKQLDQLGRVLLQFYRATNLLYRKSSEGKLAPWVASLLDQGKPESLVALQRHSTFKNSLPRVIRPDLLITEEGFSITELDSVPGGIGLTDWLNQTYSDLDKELGTWHPEGTENPDSEKAEILGGPQGLSQGFNQIFDAAQHVHVIVSEESETYRPEMQWLAERLQSDRSMTVQPATFTDFHPGDAAYRFFELFDLENVPNARTLFEHATRGDVQLSPPPKYVYEEKLLFALLWNRNLQEFWRQELGTGFLKRLQNHAPYTWVLDPSPLPPHAAYPELGLTDWHQLKTLSQKERRLILKISGFAPEAWGARGVYLGSDLSTADWSSAVDNALRAFPQNPHILQRFAKPTTVDSHWFNFETQSVEAMSGRVRLCPYYFVQGEGDQARAVLGGCLATICPADKKIIHGMRDAILAPCSR